MNQNLGYVNSIETMGLVDGPGVRVVVFMQGCTLRCAYCHNPETWCITKQEQVFSAEQLVEFICRYKNYFGENGGVTFSGGEPLVQQDFVLECAKLCKQNNIHVCLDTAGGVICKNNLLDYVDLVILDVKSIDDQAYKLLTGQDIEVFNKFLILCQEKKKSLWLRQVIVPDYNDSIQDIINLSKYIKNIKNVQKVELLPYHTTGEVKYKQLNLPYRLQGKKAMDINKCKELENSLSNLLKETTM